MPFREVFDPRKGKFRLEKILGNKQEGEVCKFCNNTGQVVEMGDVSYCNCQFGKKLKNLNKQLKVSKPDNPLDFDKEDSHGRFSEDN